MVGPRKLPRTLPKEFIFWLLTFLAPLVMLPALAAEKETGAAWQTVITQQLKAFRAGDGATALKCAGAAFKQNYSDPKQFFADIVKGGYEPLVKSRSHTFGEFKVKEGIVLQIVNLVGPDNTAYKALYQMTKEADGWRVQNVSLLKSEEGETV